MGVSRAESLAPAALRYLLVRGIRDLAQYPDAKLPEGARAIVQDANEDSPALQDPSMGNQEWMFTRQQPLTPLTFVYTNALGVSDTPSNNAILSKSGHIWVRYPQVFFVTLNGTTPVVIDDVVNQMTGGSAASSNAMCSFTRRTQGSPSGHVAVAAGSTPGTANQFTLVSDQANDDGDGVLLVWPIFRQF